MGPGVECGPVRATASVRPTRARGADRRTTDRDGGTRPRAGRPRAGSETAVAVPTGRGFLAESVQARACAAGVVADRRTSPEDTPTKAGDEDGENLVGGVSGCQARSPASLVVFRAWLIPGAEGPAAADAPGRPFQQEAGSPSSKLG